MGMARHNSFNLFLFQYQSGLFASMATFDAKRNADKGNSKRSQLGGKISKSFLCKFPFWTESTSLSPDEEEAAVQKDQKDESSGNGEVSFCFETN